MNHGAVPPAQAAPRRDSMQWHAACYLFRETFF